ncbi:hypothetical protein HPB49_013796 [Dermacentor silvarum]|uniref:Uncharacterized protein n=1 Tax=Dermacentor silvarum TaxID=543639 RepID=A0ACB8E1J4_DERSI|nr:hypothetical protein HPB49_013796 [Dermacentor silvarum]
MAELNCSSEQAQLGGDVLLVNLSAFGEELAGGVWSSNGGAPFTWSEYVKIGAYLATIAVAAVGNTCVILTVALNRSLRTTINCYLTNLAVADAIISMFCMWVYLVKNLSDWYVLGAFMCRIEGFAQRPPPLFRLKEPLSLAPVIDNDRLEIDLSRTDELSFVLAVMCRLN